MAVFLETGIDYSRIDDLPYMKRYLMILNDDLRYMFNNIAPEDNFSPEGLASYKELDDRIANIEQNMTLLDTEFANTKTEVSSGITAMDGTINLYVQTGDVTNQINLSDGIIDIEASRLHVTSDNFTVNDNYLKVRGEIEATGGNIGAFTLEKDAAGNEYLKGGTGSEIKSGIVYGAKGDFGTLTCNSGTVAMVNATWRMWNCRVASDGLKFHGGFEAGAMDVARYSETTDMYTAWYPITARGSIYAEDIYVGRNWDDSGRVRCYSVYSYFEGAEKPDPYGEDFSDRRIKENIHELSGQEALRFTEALKPVSYKLIGEDTAQLGVIAQDVIETERELSADYGIVSEHEGFYTVSYIRFIPVLAAAIEELGKEIEEWRSMKAR